MRNLIILFLGVLLLAACGQSYEETKRLTREQKREAARKDSAALKVAVMPTMDCLPLFVAQHYNLYDTLRGGVRLKYYMAQMDCDTALMRGRVEGSVTDLVRATRMAKQGTKLRYVATTNAYWQLISNRNSRVKQVKQLDDKMIAMTRYSVTDMLADIMDVLCLTEPQATWARAMKNPVVMDTRDLGWQMGVIAFREKEMQRQARGKQLELFVKAYNQACDSINKHGVTYYRDLIKDRMMLKAELVDSLPKNLKYNHAQGPRQDDVNRAEKWLEKYGNNR